MGGGIPQSDLENAAGNKAQKHQYRDHTGGDGGCGYIAGCKMHRMPRGAAGCAGVAPRIQCIGQVVRVPDSCSQYRYNKGRQGFCLCAQAPVPYRCPARSLSMTKVAEFP